jgi:hypothetical protein
MNAIIKSAVHKETSPLVFPLLGERVRVRADFYLNSDARRTTLTPGDA